MATINEHISTLRLLLNQQPDDTRYKDQFLYQRLNSARMLLLRRRIINNKRLSRFNYIPLCVKLERVSFFDCSCISSTDCLVLKSTKKIPTVLSSRFKDLFNVYTMAGKQIGATTLDRFKTLKYSETRSNKPSVAIIDGYLYVFNNLFLKALVIEGIWEDPTELVDFNICDIHGNTTTETCFDIRESEFPIDGDLHEDMYRIALDSIIQASNIPEDKINDQEEQTGI